MKNFTLTSLLLFATAALPSYCLAWGSTGHRLVSSIGMAAVSEDLPVFLKTPENLAFMGELGREPDRSKDAGLSIDRNLNPGHYVNIDDSGMIGGAVALSELPPTRESYDTALRAKGLTQYQLGYLPYSIIDGWQQLRKDFAYFRASEYGEKTATDPEDKQWYRQERRLRELLIIRNLGYWSHFVGDATQPLHVTVHYNGWGDFPNPENFTTARTFHSDFESVFVRRFMTNDIIVRRLPAASKLGCDIENIAVVLVRDTQKQVARLYTVEKLGGLEADNAAAVAFAADRIAAGAGMLRDLVASAWRCSDESSIGYPPAKLSDILAGKFSPRGAMGGYD